MVYKGESERKAFKSWYKTLVKEGLRILQDDNIEAFFTETTNTCVLFRDTNQEQEPFSLAFVEAARVHQGKQQYFYSDNSNTAQAFMMDFLKVDKEKLPLILSFNSIKNVNYVIEGAASSWTVDTIGKFVEDVNAGLIKPNIRSQPIPEEDSGFVKTIVGKNFKKIVRESGNDVMVMFYKSEEAEETMKVQPAFEEIATTYSDIKGLSFGMMDASFNDAEGIYTENTP